MHLRIIIAGVLSLTAVSCSSGEDGPTSSVRSAAFPDLTILGATYAYENTSPGWTSIIFTLRIQNVGRAPFDSLLYVGWTRSKYDLTTGYYSAVAVVRFLSSGSSIMPDPIKVGEIVEVKAATLAILDTNEVRFRIVTDRKGLGDAGQYLPLVTESNYDNNDITLRISPP